MFSEIVIIFIAFFFWSHVWNKGNSVVFSHQRFEGKQVLPQQKRHSIPEISLSAIKKQDQKRAEFMD